MILFHIVSVNVDSVFKLRIVTCGFEDRRKPKSRRENYDISVAILFRWSLQFIKSDFAGQLPKQYGKEPGATKSIPTHMNDRNLEETTRYVSINLCPKSDSMFYSGANEIRNTTNPVTTTWGVLKFIASLSETMTFDAGKGILQNFVHANDSSGYLFP